MRLQMGKDIIINMYWDAVKRAISVEWQFTATLLQPRTFGNITLQPGQTYQQDDLNIAKLDCDFKIPNKP